MQKPDKSRHETPATGKHRRAVLVGLVCLLAGLLVTATQADDIFAAIEEGDGAKIKVLLNERPELVAARNARGETPLHAAVMNGDSTLVRLLIGAGADINARDQALGGTPLLMAATLGYRDAVSTLLAEGADVDAVSFHGSTALHLAAHEGHLEIVEMLLNVGADPDVKNRNGLTPLDLALRMGQQQVAELLTRHRAGGDRPTARSWRLLQKQLTAMQRRMRESMQNYAKIEKTVQQHIEQANILRAQNEQKQSAALQKIEQKVDDTHSNFATTCRDLQQRLDDLTAQMNALRTQTTNTQQACQQVQADQAGLSNALAGMEARLTGAQQQLLAALAERVGNLESQLAELPTLRDNIARLAGRIPPAATQQIAALTEDLAETADHLDRLTDAFQRFVLQTTARTNAATQFMAAYAKRLDDIDQRLKQIETAPASTTEIIASQSAQISTLREDLARLQDRLEQLAGEFDKRWQRTDALAQLLDSEQQRLRGLTSRLQELEQLAASRLTALPPQATVPPATPTNPPAYTENLAKLQAGLAEMERAHGELSNQVGVLMAQLLRAKTNAADSTQNTEALPPSTSTQAPSIEDNRQNHGLPRGWWACAAHVHTDFSSGHYDLPTLSDVARKAKISVVLLSDSWAEVIQYGLPPWRHIFWLRRQNPSISITGLDVYLKAVDEENRRQTDVLYVPGVELVPRYYWEGALTLGHLTCRNHQRNIIVMGIQNDGTVEKLPVVNGYINTRDGFWITSTRIILLLLALACLSIFWVSPYLARRAGMPTLLIARSFFMAIILPLLILAGILDWALSRRAIFDLYSHDTACHAEQKVLDALQEHNLLHFWAHPEAPDLHEFNLAGLKFTIKTDPYPEVLLKTKGFTGFAGLNEGANQIIQPGAMWDQILSEYLSGKRATPTWCFGEMLYHYEGQAGKSLGNVQTVVHAPTRTRENLLNAIRQGDFYARRNAGEFALVLHDWRVNDASSGMTANTQDRAVQIVLDAGGTAPDNAVEVRLIRNGVEILRENRRLPFKMQYTDELPERAGKTYYRVLINGKYPLQLATNPIFVEYRGKN